MDRRYLIATLAIVATFAVVSHELRDGRVTVLASQMGLLTGGCGSSSSAPERIVSDMTARLRPAPAEEAAMLAEMNLPMIRAQAQAAALASSQAVAEAKCARETAIREAEQARSEARRAREDARRMAVPVPVSDMRPIVFQLDELPQIDQRIRIQTEVLQRRINEQTVKLQLASDRLDRIGDEVDIATSKLDIPEIVALTPVTPRCPSSRAWTQQMQDHYTRVMRNALHAVQNSWSGANTGIGKNAGYL